MMTMSRVMGSISHADLSLWQSRGVFAYPPRCTSTCMVSLATPSRIAESERSKILPPQCSSIHLDLEPLQNCRGTIGGWTGPHNVGAGLLRRWLLFVCAQRCGHCGNILGSHPHYRSPKPVRPPSLPHRSIHQAVPSARQRNPSWYSPLLPTIRMKNISPKASPRI